MIRSLRNLWRLFTVAMVLARHDALFLLDRVPGAGPARRFARLFARRGLTGRPGERLAAALAELGPTFIKFGQALSTRADLLGEEIAADLSELQDRIPPFPFAEVRRIVEGELDQSLESLFVHFDQTPVAAASIAQVHLAETAEGGPVAVKVLRPGIEHAFLRDIDVLLWLAEVVLRTQPHLRRLRPVEAVREFERSVVLEMDLRFEAAAAAELAENFRGDDTFRVPAVDWQRTGQRVFTMERVSGFKVDNPTAIHDAGLDPLRIVENAANAFFNMVFRDGFFHADMHPGNLFVDGRGNLIALDFGIMGRIDRDTRRHLGEMLLGFLTGDYRRVAEVHFEAGYIPADESVEGFTQAVRSIAEPILGKPLDEISIARLLGQLFQVTETFHMETQPQLLLLQKSMLVAEGVGRMLWADVNMWELTRPLVEQWMRENIGPQARVLEAAGTLTAAVERLPRLVTNLDTAADRIVQGGFRLHPETIREIRMPVRHPSQYIPYAIIIALLVLLLVK